LFGGDISKLQMLMPNLLEMAGNWQGISARGGRERRRIADAPFHQFTMRKNMMVMVYLRRD
jgi:hypothetical protein